MDEPKEYVAGGEIHLHGVTFYIVASSFEEAQEKARRGEYEFYEARAAEAVDWVIKASSIEENV